MQDFSNEVRSATASGRPERLLKMWNADPALVLRLDNSPVSIMRKAMSRNGHHSLENIYADAMSGGNDIAFAGIMDSHGTLREFIRGEIGAHGYWDWSAGTLLSNAVSKARHIGGRIALGHTHQRGYGAICSDALISADELLFSKTPIIEEIRQSGLFHRFCADYCETLVRSRHPMMSAYEVIASPAEDQLGVFEVRPKGVVVYHPWKIV